jgi:mono/diheme cytochrome c family protein
MKYYLSLIVCLLLMSCGSGETVIDNNGPSEIGSVDASKLYNRHCVDCHGLKGNLGLMSAKDLVSSSMSKEDRIDLITNGSENGKMQPFGIKHYGDLNDVEIEAVAIYIEELRE